MFVLGIYFRDGLDIGRKGMTGDTKLGVIRCVSSYGSGWHHVERALQRSDV